MWKGEPGKEGKVRSEMCDDGQVDILVMEDGEGLFEEVQREVRKERDKRRERRGGEELDMSADERDERRE